MILGTAAYMAPEQAPAARRPARRHLGLRRRALRMLTGQQLFAARPSPTRWPCPEGPHRLRDAARAPAHPAPPRALSRPRSEGAPARHRRSAHRHPRLARANPVLDAEPARTAQPRLTPARGFGRWLPRILFAVLFLGLAAALASISNRQLQHADRPIHRRARGGTGLHHLGLPRRSRSRRTARRWSTSPTAGCTCACWPI